MAKSWEEESGEYDHEAYAHAVELEWDMLGECPIRHGTCSKHARSKYQCHFVPGSPDWSKAWGCGPLWVEHYKMKKRVSHGKGGDGV